MTIWLTAALLVAPLVSAQDPADDPDDVEAPAASEPAPAPQAPTAPAASAPAPPRTDPADAEEQEDDDADDADDADEPDEQRGDSARGFDDGGDDDDDDGDDDGGGRDGDDDGGGRDDDADEGDYQYDGEASEGGTGVLVGSSVGYAVGGVLPAAGFGAGGLALLIAANAANESTNECASAIYLCAGVTVAALLVTPSALACGPCTATGATLGSGVGALMSGRELMWPVLGALPGLVLGVAGSALIAGGLFFAASTGEPFATGDLRVGAGFAAVLTGVGLALLAGPVAVVGATLADMQPDEEPSLLDAAASSAPFANEQGPAAVARNDDDGPVFAVAY